MKDFVAAFPCQHFLIAELSGIAPLPTAIFHILQQLLPFIVRVSESSFFLNATEIRQILTYVIACRLDALRLRWMRRLCTFGSRKTITTSLCGDWAWKAGHTFSSRVNKANGV
jgi:hypothetical protein